MHLHQIATNKFYNTFILFRDLQPLVTVYFHSIENKSSGFLHLSVTCLRFSESVSQKFLITWSHHHGNKTNSQVTMGQRFVSDIIRDPSVHIARQHLPVSIEMTTLSLDVSQTVERGQQRQCVCVCDLRLPRQHERHHSRSTFLI